MEGVPIADAVSAAAAAASRAAGLYPAGSTTSGPGHAPRAGLTYARGSLHHTAPLLASSEAAAAAMLPAE